MSHALRCPECGDWITSRSVHDFVTCTCLGLFVDGGDAYLRYGGSVDMDKVEFKDEAGNITRVNHKSPL